jgi:hypothetical protein
VCFIIPDFVSKRTCRLYGSGPLWRYRQGMAWCLSQRHEQDVGALRDVYCVLDSTNQPIIQGIYLYVN